MVVRHRQRDVPAPGVAERMEIATVDPTATLAGLAVAAPRLNEQAARTVPGCQHKSASHDRPAQRSKARVLAAQASMRVEHDLGTMRSGAAAPQVRCRRRCR